MRRAQLVKTLNFSVTSFGFGRPTKVFFSGLHSDMLHSLKRERVRKDSRRMEIKRKHLGGGEARVTLHLKERASL
jgi:hypothetical protein